MVDLVVGSGPSGVAAAQGLLARGRQVLMIDAGEVLENEQEQIRAGLAQLAPQDWREADLQRMRTKPGAGPQRFGSDFMFRDRDGVAAELPPWLGLRPSFAAGGLSNAWGAAVLPYRQEDLADWPLSAADLAPHYRAVDRFMPVSGQSDDLAGLFPEQDCRDLKPLPQSLQARALLERLQRHHAKLARTGVFFGAARQAASGDCRLCGLCLHGCPYGYIFKAQDIVTQMAAHAGFQYRPGWRLDRFVEEGGGVQVWGGGQTLEVERLFLATGVLSTARTVLASLAPRQELTLLDSQHAFLPMLQRWASSGDPAGEPRHALTQLFVELTDPEVSPFTVHAQVYTYNELYAPDMEARFLRRNRALRPVFEALARRLIVAQIFLHSDHSHRALLSLAANGRLTARRLDNPEMAPTAWRARRRLARAFSVAGLIPLLAASRLEPVGSSYHAGGTLPMRIRPQGLQTDLLGRPAGLSRVHVVDASVLPSIPATTITYSVMANAHRIASLS